MRCILVDTIDVASKSFFDWSLELEAGASETETYEIVDGVRRAKAASELGRPTIQARVNENDKPGLVVDVDIDSLYSPKDTIETGGDGFSRWRKVLRAVERGTFTDGEPVPPIAVKHGSRGTLIRDVVIEGQDDLEKLF